MGSIRRGPVDGASDSGPVGVRPAAKPGRRREGCRAESRLRGEALDCSAPTSIPAAILSGLISVPYLTLQIMTVESSDPVATTCPVADTDTQDMASRCAYVTNERNFQQKPNRRTMMTMQVRTCACATIFPLPTLVTVRLLSQCPPLNNNFVFRPFNPSRAPRRQYVERRALIEVYVLTGQCL